MIPSALAKWRVHGNSLTWKRGHLIIEETEIMLSKLMGRVPDFSIRYKKQIKILRKKACLAGAYHLFRNGRPAEARKAILNKTLFTMKGLLLFLLTLIPSKISLLLIKKFRRLGIVPN